MVKRCWGRFMIYVTVYAALLLGIMWWETQARATELSPLQAVEEHKTEAVRREAQASLPPKPLH